MLVHANNRCQCMQMAGNVVSWLRLAAAQVLLEGGRLLACLLAVALLATTLLALSNGLTASLALAGSAPVAIAGATLPPVDSPERRMYDALNAERVRLGLTPVAWSSELATAAALHSADMAANDYLDHLGLDGSDQRQRAARAGYVVPAGTGWLVIEAISAMPSMESALGWLLSDGLHRRVLLRPVWREVGIGYAAGGRYGNYWTLDFGCRPNVLPVFVDISANGQSVALTFTNENCVASGGGPTEMGRATEATLSVNEDFRNGVWEPFADTRQLPRPASSALHVRLRDASGRLSTPVRLPLDP